MLTNTLKKKIHSGVSVLLSTAGLKHFFLQKPQRVILYRYMQIQTLPPQNNPGDFWSVLKTIP